MWDKPKWGNPLLFGETDFTVGFADPMFPIRCATVVELRLQQMGDFYEKPYFTMENFKFRGAVKWGWKFLHQTTKRHTLTPNLVEQIIWRMWQWRCFDSIRRLEKKVRENCHWKLDVVYNNTSLPRRRDTVDNVRINTILYPGRLEVCSDMRRVIQGSHSFTFHQTRAIPAFTLQPQSVIAHWLVLICHPAEDRRLSSPEHTVG